MDSEFFDIDKTTRDSMRDSRSLSERPSRISKRSEVSRRNTPMENDLDRGLMSNVTQTTLGTNYVYPINVEIPLGLKIQAKFRDDMLISELLNQISHRAGVNSEEHYITFNNRELDLNATCLSVGILPNSLLKLFKGRRGSIQLDVTVTIQVKDVRFSSIFKPADSIWSCLKNLCAKDTFDTNLVPIVIYLRQELIGKESMEDVTLRDLGVAKGTCFLRFLQLQQEDLDQRKLKDDNNSEGTLESLELIAAGTTTDTGIRNVQFSSLIEEQPPEVSYIGSRNAVIYMQVEGFDPREELHNEFFDSTIEEIQQLFRDLQKNTQIQQNAPLIKRAAREDLLKKKAKKASNDETVIRVIFPNDFVIQALFAPEETIEDVRSYIKSYLNEPNDDFFLYSDPPKVTHIAFQRLGDLKKVPTGILYFAEFGPPKTQYFSEDVFRFISTYENACEAALVVRGKSLLNFMNTSNKYGDGILAKVMEMWNEAKEFLQQHMSKSGIQKRNPLVPKWMKISVSEDSLDGKALPSLLGTSNENSWSERGSITNSRLITRRYDSDDEPHPNLGPRKSILVPIPASKRGPASFMTSSSDNLVPFAPKLR